MLYPDAGWEGGATQRHRKVASLGSHSSSGVQVACPELGVQTADPACGGRPTPQQRVPSPAQPTGPVGLTDPGFTAQRGCPYLKGECHFSSVPS